MCKRGSNKSPAGNLSSVFPVVLSALGKFTIEIENLRLKFLDMPLLGIVHREEVSPFRGTVQVSVETAKTHKHYYAKYDEDLTLEEYFYIKHGIVFENPEARLVFFTVVDGDRSLASSVGNGMSASSNRLATSLPAKKSLTNACVRYKPANIGDPIFEPTTAYPVEILKSLTETSKSTHSYSLLVDHLRQHLQTICLSHVTYSPSGITQSSRNHHAIRINHRLQLRKIQMPERFPPRPDYHPQGQKSRNSGQSGGPSHRQTPRSSQPKAAPATLGGLLANVRKQDSSTNAFQGSPRDRGSSRNSSSSYQSDTHNMSGRQQYDQHRSKQQSYRGNGGHKHPRIEHPGDWRSDRTPHTGPSYTRSPIRRSSSSSISIGNV